jgi:hypothetical protein
VTRRWALAVEVGRSASTVRSWQAELRREVMPPDAGQLGSGGWVWVAGLQGWVWVAGLQGWVWVAGLQGWGWVRGIRRSREQGVRRSMVEGILSWEWLSMIRS